ncbi:hypothetical protein BCV72DRAFT_258781 [Rhizopus microsporus var. microsporus]|uniref:Uncharacterized protein n=1 Tax=Rhizopus microsporus var. microsporus TaxID=86635 RepID=A0A1X0QNW5_RHIZD|nr:hypothetical protein BCV72DRAFT_258781 [Rhizopus microsporus var. microsporus]
MADIIANASTSSDTNSLSAPQEEISQLRSSVPSRVVHSGSSLDVSQSPNPSSAASLSTPWRNPVRLQRIKQALQVQHQQQHRLQRQETASRLLQPPSSNQGFQYVYIPTKARVPIGQLLNRLRKLEINNSRRLDINYPTRSVVVLLVQNDYVPELKSQLQRFKFQIKGDFGPCNGNILQDPRYKEYTKEQQDEQALIHLTDRIERAIHHIRPCEVYSDPFLLQLRTCSQINEEIMSSHANKPEDLFLTQHDEDLDM